MTRKNKTIFVACLLILCVTAFAVWYRYFNEYYGYKPMIFSKGAWAAADAEHRGHMLDDFSRKYKIKGMTREQVVDLLGNGFDSTYMDKKVLEYPVGYRGDNPNVMFAGTHNLIIEFDENGKVRDYYIIRLDD